MKVSSFRLKIPLGVKNSEQTKLAMTQVLHEINELDVQDRHLKLHTNPVLIAYPSYISLIIQRVCLIPKYPGSPSPMLIQSYIKQNSCHFSAAYSPAVWIDTDLAEVRERDTGDPDHPQLYVRYLQLWYPRCALFYRP